MMDCNSEDGTPLEKVTVDIPKIPEGYELSHWGLVESAGTEGCLFLGHSTGEWSQIFPAHYGVCALIARPVYKPSTKLRKGCLWLFPMGQCWLVTHDQVRSAEKNTFGANWTANRYLRAADVLEDFVDPPNRRVYRVE